LEKEWSTKVVGSLGAVGSLGVVRSVAAALLIVAAGVAGWSSFANSSASATRDQLRTHAKTAPKSSNPSDVGSTNDPFVLATESVPWDPTVPNQVATITIPALDVSAPVIPEGPVGGTLAIPPDVHQVGWDHQTRSPGWPGVTLLAGHVNWVGQGEGALGGIGQLTPGDQVILNWGGIESSWVVSSPPRLTPNTIVHHSLFSTTGPPRLALVTCGGPFSETARGGSYADNVIVIASPLQPVIHSPPKRTI
jgi:sortase (surface protein transpeptidase)